MKRKSTLLFGFILAQLLFSGAVYAIPFRALASGNVSLITQNVAGARTCGPTALLYALKFGNSSLQRAYKKIPGANDNEKLKNLVFQLGKKPSRVIYHTFRLDPRDGMSAQDLFAMAGDLSAGFRWENFDRKEREAGLFVQRIYRQFHQSIANGVPVIAIFVPYTGKFSEPQNTNLWSEHNGHFVVVTGVPDSLAETSLGFEFEYLDPETGKLARGNFYEELTRGFWARKENLEGIGEWIHPEVRYGNRLVSSPYLGVLAPGLNLAPRAASDSQRVVVSLVSALGSF